MKADSRCPETTRPLAEAYRTFTATEPGYEATAALDELRAREFARLD